MTRIEKVIKIARKFRTESIINKLLISKREQDLEGKLKATAKICDIQERKINELEEELSTIDHAEACVCRQCTPELNKH